MSEQLQVQVTAEDIANGSRGKCYQCPLALAVRRHLGDVGVAVGSYDVAVITRRGETTYYCHDGLFVHAFDEADPVEPTIVTLRPMHA